MGVDIQQVVNDLFEGLPRWSPGSDDITEQAFSYVRGLPKDAKILDIGCGQGNQSLVLSDVSGLDVVAVDIDFHALKRFEGLACEYELDHKINQICADMNNLPVKERAFDLVWSESAAYIMGFEKALDNWQKYINSEGYLCLTELCWLTDEKVPDQVKSFWEKVYPGMKSYAELIDIINDKNMVINSDFLLSPESWWDEYYSPLEARFCRVRKKHNMAPEALELIESIQKEIDIHRKYSKYYGYIFFIIKMSN